MKLTSEAIANAEKMVRELSAALDRHKAGKKLSTSDHALIVSCAPKPTGRPKTQKSESFETMAVASSKMGIPLPQLKAMKRQGCPAFRGTRVYRLELVEWMEKNPIDATALMSPMDVQKLRKHKADADAKEFALQAKRGDYLHKDEVKSAVMRSVAAARSALRWKASGLSITLASMTGADPVALEERIQESNRDVIAELHRAPFGNSVVRCGKCGHEQKL